MSRHYVLSLAALTMLSLTYGGAQPAVAANDAEGATAVVRAFNEAVTARSLDKILAQLLPGGIQFGLRPAHTGVGAQQSLTADLRAHWSTIGPVLFTATKSYSRRVEIIDARAVGDIATVWTKTATETVQPDSPRPRRDSFVEVYLLARKDGQWKIGAVADNRQTDDVGLTPARP